MQIEKLLEEEKCECGSVQFSYGKKCLSCGLTEEQRINLKEIRKQLI